MERLISGIKPTGDLNIGHYIGAIKNFVEMQKAYETLIFVADLHSITISIEPEKLRQNTKNLVALYLACGLDTENTSIFLQSENLYHTNLSWVLECNSYMGELSRMTQYKEKSSKIKSDSIGCGLFTYPVLMAADILIYDADVVPVGIDQKQHVELTRNIAERFNNKYGKTFKVPTPIIAKQGAKIMDLQDPTKKMSKSSDNQKGCIQLLDDLEVARKKIMTAVTDSESSVKFDPDNKPGIANLMTIYSSLNNKSFEEIEDEFKGANYGTFKTKVADEVVNLLQNIQNKYNQIINDNVLEKVLDDGLAFVKDLADSKTKAVFKKVGLGR